MKRDDVCFLLLHGYGGGLFETEGLARLLESAGYNAVLPQLHGHGGDRRLLASARKAEWLRQARQEYARLSLKYKYVIVIGFSMGGLIAAHMGGIGNAYAIIFINTPIYYWNIKQIYMNLRSDFNKYLRYYFAHSTNKPLISLYQFLSLLRHIKRQLHTVSCPCLILQALDDDTTKPKSAEFIYNEIKSQHKRKIYYERGGHDILRSDMLRSVALDIIHFTKELDDGEEKE